MISVWREVYINAIHLFFKHYPFFEFTLYPPPFYTDLLLYLHVKFPFFLCWWVLVDDTSCRILSQATNRIEVLPLWCVHLYIQKYR